MHVSIALHQVFKNNIYLVLIQYITRNDYRGQLTQLSLKMFRLWINNLRADIQHFTRKTRILLRVKARLWRNRYLPCVT